MNVVRLYEDRTVRRLYRTEQLQDAKGFKQVEDGTEEIWYEVLIDKDAISGMARRAATNKRKRSVDGPLTVRVVGQKRHQ